MVQYLQVHCDKFALLVETGVIEEVVSMQDIQCEDVIWRGRELPFVDLTALLTGEESRDNRDCLIFKGLDASEAQKQAYYAIAVGGVSNIESIKEQDFVDIPSLDFHYNHYFDKAYIHPASKQCVYRLRRDAFEESV